MIRIHFKKLLDDKAFRERRRISLQEVCDATGVSRPTLTRISNVAGYSTSTETLDELCRYFECQPGDLLSYIEEGDEKV